VIIVLTIFVGALIGALMGVIAEKLISEINSQVNVSRIKFLVTGVALGALFALLVCQRFATWDLRIAYSTLCAGLILQTTVDALTHRLVRSITHLTAIVGFIFLAVNAIRVEESSQLISAVTCAATSWCLFFVISKVAPTGLGTGDVRLVPVLGLYLGFLGYNEAILGIFIACSSAGLVGVVLIAVGRGSLKRRFAFGPYLAFGTFICIFAGDALPRLFLN
jgi:leader peptidase (prepilin peptidase)/N-methyltransferase